SLPPYGAANYCVNASIQFYDPALHPLGHNIRLTQHTWDPQLNAPHTGSATGERTFIGDYFGNTTGPSATGTLDYSTFVSTYDDGTNPAHYQQQIVATVAVPCPPGGPLTTRAAPRPGSQNLPAQGSSTQRVSGRSPAPARPASSACPPTPRLVKFGLPLSKSPAS